MFRAAIPVLHVSSSRKAEELYCGKLGCPEPDVSAPS